MYNLTPREDKGIIKHFPFCLSCIRITSPFGDLVNNSFLFIKLNFGVNVCVFISYLGLSYPYLFQ